MGEGYNKESNWDNLQICVCTCLWVMVCASMWCACCWLFFFFFFFFAFSFIGKRLAIFYSIALPQSSMPSMRKPWRQQANTKSGQGIWSSQRLGPCDSVSSAWKPLKHFGKRKTNLEYVRGDSRTRQHFQSGSGPDVLSKSTERPRNALWGRSWTSRLLSFCFVSWGRVRWSIFSISLVYGSIRIW